MNDKVDLLEFIKKFENMRVTEIEEEIGQWNFSIDDLPVNLKIKVLKDVNGKFTGIANYLIQNPDQATPYISIRTKDSVEEALWDSLMGFLSFWKPEKKETTKFVPYDNW